MSMTEDLRHIRGKSLKCFFDARIIKLPKAHAAGPAGGWQKFVGMPLKQWTVPNLYTKQGFHVAGDTPITAEEGAKLNVLDFGNFPVPRCEVLNWVTYSNR